MIYRRSHVIPTVDDPRGGCLDFGSIPAFLTRGGYDDSKESGVTVWPFLRMSLRASVPGEDTIVLDRDQVVALRDELSRWLERVDPELIGK